MKRFLSVISLLFSMLFCRGQNAQFYFYLPDNSLITGLSKSPPTITPIFSDAGINSIISNYEIYVWRKADPLSNYGYLRNTYLVECNDIQLAYDLQSYAPQIFGTMQIQAPVTMTSDTPRDYGPYNNRYLDLINAPGAWHISKGDTNTIIGITDTYFDLSHEELSSKIINVSANNMPFDDIYHGTAVAGFAAGATDNGPNGDIGFSSIGWNCRLDVSSNKSLNEMRDMVDRGCKVVNASWFAFSKSTLDSGFALSFYDQGLSNTIYDKGATACFGAGNGRFTGEQNARNYTFPPSLDHNISVSSVGWENDTAALNPGDTCFNCKWVHEIKSNDTGFSSGSCFQHNDRVDICSPGVRVGGLYYDPNDPNKHYEWSGLWGTSFSSPTVAGICGLMYTANKWITPYQVEWVLKQTAKDIYNVSYNKKYYDGHSRFTSRLGAGVIQADEAVSMARDIDPYRTNTYTFRVSGIDITTLCTPDSFPGVPNPRLFVKLEHGTPPYKFRWEPLSDNECTLNFATGYDAPTVSASTGGHLLHYLLTVYDSSEVMKVANKEIKIQLRHDAVADLAMQDAYMDMLNEPNDMWSVNPINWNIWESPDIWNRQHMGSGSEHEDPDYGLGQNYMHVHVKNVGCVSSSPETPLAVYWTIASTGETWPMDWVGTGPTINGQPCGDTAYITGVPTLAPGAATEIVNAWTPPRPQDYDSTITNLEVCVLARIIEGGPPTYGMTFPEDTDVNINVRNNNNIVTRNLVVNNYSGAKKSTNTIVVVGNTSSSSGIFSLDLVTRRHLNPSFEGNLSIYMTGTINLGDDLYGIWVSGGRQGHVLSYNDDLKTVTTDFSEPLRLDNLAMDGNAKFITHVILTLNDGMVVGDSVIDERVYLRQLQTETQVINNGDGNSFTHDVDAVRGSVNFAVNIEGGSGTKPSPNNVKVQSKAKEYAFVIYPNPATNRLTIASKDKSAAVSSLSIIDISGRTLIKEKNPTFRTGMHELNIGDLPPGSYFVKLLMPQGMSYMYKFIKSAEE